MDDPQERVGESSPPERQRNGNGVFVQPAVCLLQERMLSQSGMNARSRDLYGLRCLPGTVTLINI